MVGSSRQEAGSQPGQAGGQAGAGAGGEEGGEAGQDQVQASPGSCPRGGEEQRRVRGALQGGQVDEESGRQGSCSGMEISKCFKQFKLITNYVAYMRTCCVTPP